MKIGIGIDTGGTYTDAVAYDFEKGRLLHSVKALTTTDDLSKGIGNALDSLPEEIRRKAELISLSTTLATNACVEDRRGRAKLVLIGADREIIRKAGGRYGLPDPEDIEFIDSDCDFSGAISKHPDWDLFVSKSRNWASSTDAAGIVSIHAMKNNAVLEKKARTLLNHIYGLPIVCGHELFSDLNLLQRGSGTLLNAGLIPLIKEFLDAVRSALIARNISAPVVIVRSDGSVMSEDFTSARPVETLLSGPAASIQGGAGLGGTGNCLIIDMGGTTTDISMVVNSVPVYVDEGISIGKWKTFVKGVSTDTFGLGGDSRIVYDKRGRLHLESHRVVPISSASSAFPEIRAGLKKLLFRTKKHTFPLYEAFISRKGIEGSEQYTEKEKALVRELRKSPLMCSEAAEVCGTDIYNLDVTRLERDGIIQRCGLTPTDMMHIKGDFTPFDTEVAEIAMNFAAASTASDISVFPDMVYDMVKSKLYFNIVRVLLEREYPEHRKTGLGKDMEKHIYESWRSRKLMQENRFIRNSFHTGFALVGIGAPTHIFIKDVADALGTDCVTPQHAGVAGALGAIMGNIRAVSRIEIKPEYTVSGITGYIVFGRNINSRADSLEEAVRTAREEAASAASEEAVRRGAKGPVAISTKISSDIAKTAADTEVYLGTTVAATAVGKTPVGSGCFQ